MTLNQIVAAANLFTDENFTAEIVVNYTNEAIGKINATVDANLPMFSSATADTAYTALSESYLRILIVPYAAYGIKMNDGSLNEAKGYMDQWEEGFKILEQNKWKAIALAYRGEGFGGMYQIDTSNGMNVGWFNPTTNNTGMEGD